MKQLSHWAKAHVFQARLLIVLGRIVLAVWGYTAGIWCALQGYSFQEGAFLLSGLLFLLAYMAYPRRSGTGWLARRGFVWRKSCDAALVLSSLACWLALGNGLPSRLQEPAPLPISQTNVLTTLPIATASMLAPSSPPAKMSFFKKRQVWRPLKKSLRQYVQTIRAVRQGEKGWMIALLIVANLLLVVVAGYLILLLSCTLSCNGQEGAAVVVLIGGLSLLVWLSVTIWLAGLRWIKRKNQTEPRTI